MKIVQFKKIFEKHINLNIELSKKTLLDYKKIFEIFNLLNRKIKSKKKIYVYGNGGSFADASHFVSELTATYKNKNRIGLPFVLLSSNISSLTAWSNDLDYASYLDREVQTHISTGDILILISTSGGNYKSKQSINLLNAAKKAKKNKIYVVGILGNNGGDLKKYCNKSYVVKSKNTPSIQENHKLIFHIICELFDLVY